MTRSIAAVLLLATSLSLTTPSPAEAQLGGLIKKKVKEAIKKPEAPPKTTEPSSASSPAAPEPASSSPSTRNSDPTGFGSAIIEITPPTFDELMRALQMEIDLQAALKKEIARYGTHDQYEACKIRVAQSPEGQKAMNPMYNPPKNVTGEEYMKIQMKVSADMDSLTNKGCPLNPSYWSPLRIDASLDSIREKAAGSITIADMSPEPSLTVAQLRFEIMPSLYESHVFLDSQLYAIALERIDRLCEYKGFGSGSVGAGAVDSLPKKDPQKNPRSVAPLKIPGVGRDIYWMYTVNEVDVITSPRCKRYYSLVKQLMH
jgi:hypothetical protein